MGLKGMQGFESMTITLEEYKRREAEKEKEGKHKVRRKARSASSKMER